MSIAELALYFSTIAIFLISLSVHEYAHAREAIAAYGRFATYGLVILIAFIVLGGFERFILPLEKVVYTFLRLPLSLL